ncbi:hypothetical protein CM07_gp71 [Mycobacterium phage Alma]|uniref:Uncharacterized protein n=1 Tax=Mycobacterium phage Alma TaxID=2902800 RepID=G8I7Q4_9CAUD|nr:hypothetical protein CM07_gp71 [Mycobacterium phage Alma]AER48810.1 hypothetical protein ALMA_35 [Mycobacterium phage Alma]
MEPLRIAYGGHRLGNYSSPQAGMLKVTATEPPVPRSGCPSIYPRWMGLDRHALSGMSASAALTGDDRAGEARHPTRVSRHGSLPRALGTICQVPLLESATAP